jgi:hypothetical protein
MPLDQIQDRRVADRSVDDAIILQAIWRQMAKLHGHARIHPTSA